MGEITSNIESEVCNIARKTLKLQLIQCKLQQTVLNLIISTKMRGIRLGQVIHYENILRSDFGFPDVDEGLRRRNLYGVVKNF